MKLYLLIITVSFFASATVAQPPAIIPSTTPTIVGIRGDSSIDHFRPAFEDIIIYRLQLYITTGKGNSAGTDDPVYVLMNHNDNPFYLVRGIDNFQEGKQVYYEVLSEHIKTIKDIEFIKFGIKGNDGVCIKDLSLVINDQIVFTKTYPGNAGQCIDNNSTSLSPTFEITKAALSYSPNWRYTPANEMMWKPYKHISKEWLVALVEAAVGNSLYETETAIKWGTKSDINPTLWGDAVEAKYINDHTVLFDLDLKWVVTGPDLEVDIDFSLEFDCDGGHLAFKRQGPYTIKTLLYGTDLGPLKNPNPAITNRIMNSIYRISDYYAFPIKFSNAVPKGLSFGCNCYHEEGCIMLWGPKASTWNDNFLIIPQRE